VHPKNTPDSIHLIHDVQGFLSIITASPNRLELLHTVHLVRSMSHSSTTSVTSSTGGSASRVSSAEDDTTPLLDSHISTGQITLPDIETRQYLHGSFATFESYNGHQFSMIEDSDLTDRNPRHGRLHRSIFHAFQKSLNAVNGKNRIRSELQLTQTCQRFGRNYKNIDISFDGVSALPPDRKVSETLTVRITVADSLKHLIRHSLGLDAIEVGRRLRSVVQTRRLGIPKFASQ